MATLKQRLHRKNSSGSYDTVHLETSSSLVLRPSGRSVEQDLEAYLPKVQDSDNVPESLTFGHILLGQTKMWFGDINNQPMEVFIMGSEFNIGTIGGMTVTEYLDLMKSKGIGIVNEVALSNLALFGSMTPEQLMDMMVAKGIGIAGSNNEDDANVSEAINTGLLEGRLISGETVRFDGMYWVVAHADYVNRLAYLASNIIVTNTIFGSNNTYKGSTLATVAASFENTMSAAAKAVMADVTVNGVTAKVFAPSYDQMNGGWSYFATQANRVCNFNGAATNWWTSSPNSSNVYCVGTNGSLVAGNPSITIGFRPCVALKL